MQRIVLASLLSLLAGATLASDPTPSPSAAPAPTATASTAFPWPNGARAAISLAYDDAIDSQLDVAAPALARHGLRASFYLTLASPTLAKRLPEWRALAAAGHELGNHTLFHQCSRTPAGREWVTPENDLDTTPVGSSRVDLQACKLEYSIVSPK